MAYSANNNYCHQYIDAFAPVAEGVVDHGDQLAVGLNHVVLGTRNIEVRGLPLIHDKTVDEWGTAGSWLFHDRATCPVEVRGLPLIHDKTVDEWGTAFYGSW